MTRKQLTTGIAVSVSLVVLAFFFALLNPLMLAQQNGQQAAADQSADQFVVQDEMIGTGATAKAGDTVTFHFTGKLQDGTVFESSVGKQPIQRPLGVGQLIPGLDQGMQGMKVGGKRLLIVPAPLAYGAQAAGPIPPNSTLIIEVTLVGVQPAGAGPTTAQ